MLYVVYVFLLDMHEGEYILDSLSGCAVNKKKRNSVHLHWMLHGQVDLIVRRSLRATFWFACYK